MKSGCESNSNSTGWIHLILSALPARRGRRAVIAIILCLPLVIK